jgi:hypothetical protein
MELFLELHSGNRITGCDFSTRTELTEVILHQNTKFTNSLQLCVITSVSMEEYVLILTSVIALVCTLTRATLHLNHE